MKRGWKMWMCVLALSGLSAAARADIAVPPNDYTGFLFRERHYFSVLPGGGFGELLERHPGLPGWLALGFLVFCGTVLVLLVASAWAKVCGKTRPPGKPNRKAKFVEWCIVGTLILWGLAAAWETLVTGPALTGSAWPSMLYFDTPKWRAEYDRHCIDWYTRHRGDWTGEHSYIYWRGVPRMRKGAPEAVTNAYEAFRESLRSERDMQERGQSLADRAEELGETITGGE
ncbi:MAG: hypothetical protein IK066_11480 [Kiritimatiellae bacterium]|nr:hypothetical protein [Kiritimatiellia bacterium]